MKYSQYKFFNDILFTAAAVVIVACLAIGLAGNGTGIDDIQVGRFAGVQQSPASIPEGRADQLRFKRVDLASQGLNRGRSDQTEKLSPQPQVSFTLGF